MKLDIHAIGRIAGPAAALLTWWLLPETYGADEPVEFGSDLGRFGDLDE